MSYLARLGGRPSRRRPAPPRYDLEVLEGRTLLSGAGAASPASHVTITTTTALTTSLPTAVTGAESTFTATVENAATNTPMHSGRVTFVVESPQKTVLGVAGVDRKGQALLTTDELTKLTTDQIVAEYTPTNPSVLASQSAPIAVQVIPQPLHVPTTITIESGAPKAEKGQLVPLVAEVKDAGTGNQAHAGKVQPITGIVQFYTNSPRHIILGSIPLNQTGTTTSTSSLLSAIQSAFGISSTSSTSSEKQRLILLTNKLSQIGPDEVQARFLPSNGYFAASASAPRTVTITPQTRNAPTVTTIQAATSTIETGEDVTLHATVENPSSSLAGGVVEFRTVSPHPVVLGKVNVTAFGEQVSLTTKRVQRVGADRIRAVYLPGNDLFARSVSAPATITVTPLTAASFRVTPVVGPGEVHEPLSFTVTALDARGHRLLSYNGTVVFTSPTDSLPNFPPGVYSTLGIAPPSPATPGLASFTPTSYTFTTADQGSHTFTDAVQFGKAGEETVQVIQANDPKVSGMTTFAIG